VKVEGASVALLICSHARTRPKKKEVKMECSFHRAEDLWAGGRLLLEYFVPEAESCTQLH
jgi:hypothetical protein